MAIARACISVAADAMAARPPELAHVSVAAVIRWPDAEGSCVLFFFDPDYFRSFEDQTHEVYPWTPLGPERSLMRELGIVDPNLRERGYHERIIEDFEDPPYVYETDIWMIGD